MRPTASAIIALLVLSLLPTAIAAGPADPAAPAEHCLRDDAGDVEEGLADLVEVCLALGDGVTIRADLTAPPPEGMSLSITLETPLPPTLHAGDTVQTQHVGSVSVGWGPAGPEVHQEPVPCEIQASASSATSVEVFLADADCIGGPEVLLAQVRVYSYDGERNGEDCPGSCTRTWLRVPFVPNDDLAGASPLTLGTPTPVDNRSAGDEEGEQPHAGVGRRSVWFEVTPPSSGPLTVSTAGSAFDTVVAVYRGTALADLQQVAASDDVAGALTSSATVDAEAGVRYLIAVSGYRGDFGLGVVVVDRPGATADASVAPRVGSVLDDLPTAEGTLAMFDQASTGRSPVDVALAFSETTFPEGASTVTIARADTFPDALASGALQQDGPLLLVPPTGGLPLGVAQEISRLAPLETVILGGTAAVSQQVEEDLRALGPQVVRLGGATRFETAASIAGRTATTGGTVIVVRGDDDGTGDPSRAFADSLASGGLAAARGWPIVLTGREALPQPTRAFLAGVTPQTIVVVGGTGAVSSAVEAELAAFAPVRRIAGGSRVDTAIAVAEELGQQRGAGGVAGVSLVDGERPDGWVGGLVAAARTGQLGAPVLLGAGATLPQATAEWIRSNVSIDQGGDVVIACVVAYQSCEAARRITGLSAAPLFTLDPPGGTILDGPTTLRIQVDPPAEAAGRQLGLYSDCADISGGGVGGQLGVTLDAQGQAEIALVPDAARGCHVSMNMQLTGGSTHYSSYFLPPPPDDVTHALPQSLYLDVRTEPPYLTAPAAVDVSGSCLPGAGTTDGAAQPSVNTGRHLPFDTRSFKSLADAIGSGRSPYLANLGDATSCELALGVPPETVDVRWEVTDLTSQGEIRTGASTQVQRPVLAAGHGSHVAFSLEGAERLGLLLALSVELTMSTTNPSAVALPPAEEVRVELGHEDGIQVTCDDGTATADDDYEVHVADGAVCQVAAPTPVVVLQAGTPVVRTTDPQFVADSTRGPVEVITLIDPDSFGGGVAVSVTTAGPLDRPLVVPARSSCAQEQDPATGLVVHHHPAGANPHTETTWLAVRDRCTIALELPASTVGGAEWVLQREEYDPDAREVTVTTLATGTGLSAEVEQDLLSREDLVVFRWVVDLVGDPPPVEVTAGSLIPIQTVHGAFSYQVVCDDGSRADDNTFELVPVPAGTSCTVNPTGFTNDEQLILSRWNQPFTFGQELTFTATAEGGPITIMTTAADPV